MGYRESALLGTARGTGGHRRRRRLCDSLHGARRALGYRHDQPDCLGYAACVRDLFDRSRLRRAERRIDQFGVRPVNVQAAGPAFRADGDHAAGRWPDCTRARPRPAEPPDRRDDDLQFQIHLCLEHLSLRRLSRHCRRLPLYNDGTQGESVQSRCRCVRLCVASRADHGYRFHLWVSGRASRL